MMKNSKFLMFLALSIVLFSFSSCGDPEKVIFNGEPGDQTLLTFNQISLNLPIETDADGFVVVEVDISTRAPQDRTFHIEVLEDSTTADPASFEVPSTVTIPANEYVATFTITGLDITAAIETTPEIVTIKLTATDPNIMLESNVAVVNVYEYCPIPSDFLVGEYRVEDVVGTLGALFTTPGPNIETNIVTISIGETSTERVFSINTLPAIGGNTTNMVLNLLCGEFTITGEINTGVFCSFKDADQTIPRYVVYTTASDGDFANSTYDALNEMQTYVINYTDDANGSCISPALSSFRLTKIN